MCVWYIVDPKLTYNMKYIITGGAGFIGSHLSQTLIDHGEKVVVIDNLTTGNAINLKGVIHHKNFTFLQTDVQTIKYWNRILSENDIIIHLAATVGVNKVMVNSMETIKNNSHCTQIILDAAVKHGCKVFFASTSEVYGNSDSVYSTETDALVIPGTYCGRAAYVLGKLMSEHYCINYHQHLNLPVIVARFFNVIGTRQSDAHGMVAPTFIRQALSNKPITIFGDGTQTRSFADVADTVTSVLKLIYTKEAYGEVFNIGADENITILELAKYIKAETNSASPIVFVPSPEQRSQGRDIHYRRPSLTKINNLLGCAPQVHWKTTVNRIIKYQIDLQQLETPDNAMDRFIYQADVNVS